MLGCHLDHMGMILRARKKEGAALCKDAMCLSAILAGGLVLQGLHLNGQLKASALLCDSGSRQIGL